MNVSLHVARSQRLHWSYSAARHDGDAGLPARRAPLREKRSVVARPELAREIHATRDPAEGSAKRLLVDEDDSTPSSCRSARHRSPATARWPSAATPRVTATDSPASASWSAVESSARPRSHAHRAGAP